MQTVLSWTLGILAFIIFIVILCYVEMKDQERREKDRAESRQYRLQGKTDALRMRLTIEQQKEERLKREALEQARKELKKEKGEGG